MHTLEARCQLLTFEGPVHRLDDEAGLLEGGSTVGMDVLK